MATLPPSANGTDLSRSESVPSVSPEERIIYLENRLAILETEVQRFKNALFAAGEFMMKNPATKMMISALPKDAQKQLKEFFDGQATGR